MFFIPRQPWTLRFRRYLWKKPCPKSYTKTTRGSVRVRGTNVQLDSSWNSVWTWFVMWIGDWMHLHFTQSRMVRRKFWSKKSQSHHNCSLIPSLAVSPISILSICCSKSCSCFVQNLPCVLCSSKDPFGLVCIFFVTFYMMFFNILAWECTRKHPPHSSYLQLVVI